MLWHHHMFNKANLRDLIAVTSLEILLKFDPNHQFFSPCDLEIWWMTSTSSLLHHIKSFGEFKLKLQSGNPQFRSKSAIFCPVWPWNLMHDLGKTIRHLFYTTSNFVHHFKAMGEFKLELQSRNTQFRSKLAIFFPVWPWNLMNDLEKQQGTSYMLLQALCIIL